MLDEIRQPVVDAMPSRPSGARPWQAWALRILPPLLLLWPLSTRNGPTLYLCIALLLPILLWCFVTLAANLIRWQPTQLVRPALCIAIALAWGPYLEYSMTPAVRYVDALAERIHARCNATGRCPSRIEGWSSPGPGISASSYGKWVKWRIEYRPDGARFQIWIRVSLDNIRVASGGVGKELVLIHAPESARR
jgi:hypothetical protein